MQKWEYSRYGIFSDYTVNSSFEEVLFKSKELVQWKGKVDDFLNHLGEQGWELVSVASTSGYYQYYLFKRPKP